jgi:hypothetical protein
VCIRQEYPKILKNDVELLLAKLGLLLNVEAQIGQMI